MQENGRDIWVEYLLLGMLALLWGSSYLFIRVALEGIPPVTLMAVRVTVAAVIMLLLVFSLGQRLPETAADWRRLLVQAFLNSIGAWTLLAWGQQYVESGLAAVLNSTSPVFVFLIGLAFLRKSSRSPGKLAGACLGMAGVVLIAGLDVLQGFGKQVLAQLAVTGGAVLYAGAALYGRNLAHLHPAVSAAGTMIWAVVWLVPASLILEQPWTMRPAPQALLAAAFLSVFCTGLALIIYFRLLRTLGAMGVSSQSYLRAGIGVVLGMMVLGETLTTGQALGLALALAGVVVINLPQGGLVRFKARGRQPQPD